jgi:hypothetical protein
MKATIKVGFSNYRNVHALFWHILRFHFFLLLTDHINLDNIIVQTDVHMQL